MGDFLRLILDSIQYLWPFRIIEQFERGVYHVFGKPIRVPTWYGGPECTPGRLWIVIPFFTEIRTVVTVRDVIVTDVQTITCSDGGTLTFSATVSIAVSDANLAYNAVRQYAETVREDVSAILAERLAEVDVDRFKPEARGRLIGACRQSLGTQLAAYGVQVTSLRLNNFVRNIPVGRLFNDQLYPNNSGN